MSYRGTIPSYAIVRALAGPGGERQGGRDAKRRSLLPWIVAAVTMAALYFAAGRF
jgi:hypothetical protein